MDKANRLFATFGYKCLRGGIQPFLNSLIPIFTLYTVGKPTLLKQQLMTTAALMRWGKKVAQDKVMSPAVKTTTKT
jgi:hypothetical protein